MYNDDDDEEEDRDKFNDVPSSIPAV